MMYQSLVVCTRCRGRPTHCVLLATYAHAISAYDALESRDQILTPMELGLYAQESRSRRRATLAK